MLSFQTDDAKNPQHDYLGERDDLVSMKYIFKNKTLCCWI